MNIILLGYGRMGRDVEQVAVERGHAIVARYWVEDPLPKANALPDAVKSASCAIDFSSPDATEHHLRTLGPLHIPLVVGTTGWNSRLPALLDFMRGCGGTIMVASNFSIGANVLFHAAAEAARILNRFPEYDVAVHEVHHRLKKDAPSGTALTLASKILGVMKRKTEVLTSLGNRQIAPHELLVTSGRVGSVAGIHTATFDSAADTLEITHTARSRRGFAEGAVSAAEWIQGRTGVFTMEDFLFKS
ncbi:MAG TPA: 4-hydroxy-tetrahydrodipicolinate reductase [Bacteroidota bacterium]|nr:4-hydroxy-tetrahydrodipicolinate reductase [Bacteroidota bacterium]